MTKYDVILADPPWQNYGWATGSGRKAPANHYELMSIEDIAALPVAKMSADNCALFLWAVWPDIFRAQEVIEAWGFRYSTIAWVWAKLTKSSMGFHWGLGSYTRANTEPCLLCIRGSMPPAVKDVQALIVSPVRKHSQKPDEQYNKIERLYPNTQKLELFARHKQPTWDSWGNEINSDIDLTTTLTTDPTPRPRPAKGSTRSSVSCTGRGALLR